MPDPIAESAAGHIREMIQAHNYNPGNAGIIFYYDLTAPRAVIGLYAAS